MKSLPLSAARALALHAQQLATPYGEEPEPRPGAIAALVERLGAVQVDTLQRVQRSHYLTIWSRLGAYDPDDFDRLIYPRRAQDEAQRLLFEDWYHAACILPFSDYRYRLPLKRRLRKKPANFTQSLLNKQDSDHFLASVLKRIGREGPLAVSDFKSDGKRRGSWWDWRPAKVALEHLFVIGDLMIADRVHFQRYYDLTKRVLPAWVDRRVPSQDATLRHLLARSVRSFGICRPAQAADAVHELGRGRVRPIVESMIEEGVFVPVRVESSDGIDLEMMVHREDRPLLERAADGSLAAARTTFLNPFDSLFWPQGRDEELWGFEQVLEAYKPAAQRRWGYFCLPILHGDRLVGRFDPKLERANGTLRLVALYLEPGVKPDARLIAGVAQALRDFLVFHQATDVVIEKSEPAAFGRKLLAAL